MNWENLPSTNTPINATNLAKITDSGSTADGRYIKFQDGSLLQWGIKQFSSGGTNADGYALVTFPVAFIGDYSITANSCYINQTGGLGTVLTPSNPTSGTNSSNYVYRRLTYLPPTDSGQTALYSVAQKFYWIATGRWKA